MSYILEALKKSERERAKGNIPTLETVSDTGVSRRALWLGVLIGAGALLLVALAAWLVSQQFLRTDSSPVRSATPPATSVDEPSASTSTGEDPAPAEASTTRADEPRESGSEAASQPTSEAREPQAPQRVAGISDLDPDAQARVRDVSVNVVSYSRTPERRFVMLNQRIFRESDRVDDGVTVKEILPEGVLLQVGDYEVVLEAD